MTTLDWLLTAALLLQLIDVHSTIGALDRGGVEKNPVIRWLMTRLGRGWIAVKLALGCGGAVGLYFSGLPFAPAMLAALCALYAVVVARNYGVGR